MAVTPTGSSAKQLAALQDIIANCATFRALVGAADAASAKGSIYIDAFIPLDDEGNRLADLTTLRPLAIIEDGDRNYEHSSTDTAQHFDLEATYLVSFEADVPEAYQGDGAMQDAGYWFRNIVDAILEEMQALTGTYIRFKSIAQEMEMTRNRPAKKGKSGDFFTWVFRVTVG